MNTVSTLFRLQSSKYLLHICLCVQIASIGTTKVTPTLFCTLVSCTNDAVAQEVVGLATMTHDQDWDIPSVRRTILRLIKQQRENMVHCLFEKFGVELIVPPAERDGADDADDNTTTNITSSTNGAAPFKDSCSSAVWFVNSCLIQAMIAGLPSFVESLVVRYDLLHLHRHSHQGPLLSTYFLASLISYFIRSVAAYFSSN